MTDRNISEIIDFAAEAGLCLLEYGAETQRVEDTTMRILDHYAGRGAEVIAMLTGVTVSVGTQTKAVRVRERTMNLHKISEINQLSREIADADLPLADAERRLEEIRAQKPYPFALRTAAFGVCCGFFTLLFGGGIFDAANGFLTGIVLNCVSALLSKRRVAPFLVTLAGGATVSLCALAIDLFGLGKNIDAVIIGSIMPLVPGMGITNALRDLSQGDYLSGGARFFDALMTAIAVAAGAGGVVQIWRFFGWI